MAQFSRLPVEIQIHIIKLAAYLSLGIACWSCALCTPRNRDILTHNKDVVGKASPLLMKSSDDTLPKPSSWQWLDRSSRQHRLQEEAYATHPEWKHEQPIALWTLLATSKAMRAILFDLGLSIHLCSFKCFFHWTVTGPPSLQGLFAKTVIRGWNWEFESLDADLEAHKDQEQARAFGMAVRCKNVYQRYVRLVSKYNWSFSVDHVRKPRPGLLTVLAAWEVTLESEKPGDTLFLQ